MDFGKTPRFATVDFRLPAPSSRTQRFLERSRFEGPREIWTGAPVWAVKSWVGSVYPAGAKSSDFLRHYARQFKTIELNATFYRIPDAATTDQWRLSTPEDFRFCPKVHQDISHGPSLTGRPEVIDAFVESCLRLGTRLGYSFLQLPPHFGPAQLRELDRFLAMLPAKFPMAVEFRHPAWFQRGELRSEAVELLERRGVATVITDVAGRRDVSHASITAPAVLLRFVGNALHSTDFTRADAWAERFKLWFDQGLKEAYVFAHEPEDPDSGIENGQVPAMIHALNQKLTRATGIPIRDWTPEPSQMSLLG